ncbi:non-ribosomal peptide synthetase [Paenibacillus sp. YYML68]|uniref:non-ribosomal peptide synthetase n=1 Tax=Paenibacillus sp. YYML68 TaxID=2909250 RepID=UPI0024925B91|nr:non-ribosomal peptide synthetase [Paenibacillus sp. YYML68]
MKKNMTYWNERFHSGDTISCFPYSKPATIAGKTMEAASRAVYSIVLPAEQSERIISIVKGAERGILTILLTAVQSLLYKYTNASTIIIGLPTIPEPGAPRINDIVLLKNEVADSSSFKSMLTEMSATVRDAIASQDVPFQRMIGDLSLQADPDGTPIIHTVVSLHTDGSASNSHADDIRSDIHYRFIRQDQSILAEVVYNESRYDVAAIERIISHLNNLLAIQLFQPEAALGGIEMMTDAEKRQLLVEFNDTEAAYPSDQTIHGMFEQQAERTPDQVAVLFEDEQLTYRELNERANRLARTLRAEGVKPDQKVVLVAERSMEMMVAIFAILKAGGAYVPVDPEYPEDRIAYMLEDSAAGLLLTQSHLRERVAGLEGASFTGKVIDLNDEANYAVEGSNLEPAAGPTDVAYMIYTSGSTGKPKGVMVEHHSVLNRILWMHKKYPIGASDTIMQKTTITFDVSVWELFWWSFVGSKVCLLQPGGEKSPERILETIERYEITTMHFVPAMLGAFLEYVEQQSRERLIRMLRPLRQVFASGEALPPQHVARFQHTVAAENKALLINVYGPTEATVDVSYFDCEPDGQYPMVPIGKPIDNIHLYVVREGTLQLQPIGVAGELVIAGVGVARGYLNRPELNAEKFIDSPFVAGERMYRTGDLVRWMPDGNIEYLGRIDHQVKIRGYRIELGEVESHLLNIETVLEAVVTAREDETGQKLLAAYFVAERDITPGELREQLSAELPSYMVPTYFVQLERMPLSANGKIDRKRLPAPEASVRSGAEYVAPRTETEQRLAELWQDVLGIERVGALDNFFDIGGHSLRATTLVARVHKAFGKQLQIKDVFDALTLEKLAERLDGLASESYVHIPVADKQQYYPVSSAQKRLFILSLLPGGETGYNMPGVLQLDGALDIAGLEAAFRQLIARHDTLRTSFELVEGEPKQQVHDAVHFALERIDLQNEAGVAEASEAEAIAAAIQAFVRPFDLAKAPLVRSGLIELAAERHLLLVDMHHIISDGVSLSVFIDELARLYAGEELAPMHLQYKDYAVWQQAGEGADKLKQQEAYWLDTFRQEVPVLDLPADYPRPAVQSFDGARYEFTLDREAANSLRQLAKQTGSTLYMVLLAVYTTLLHKYTGQEDIVVGVPVAGRSNADLEPIIGMFVNTLALRQYPAGEKSFSDYLLEVKEGSLQAFSHPEYPFEDLVEQLKLKKDMSRNPLFDTMFELKNIDTTEPRMDGLRISSYPNPHASAKVDLSIEVYEEQDELLFSLEYATALFKPETMERFGQHFSELATAIGLAPQRKLGELSMTSEQEQVQLLEAFNGMLSPEPIDHTFHRLFEQQAEKTPAHIAVRFKDTALTYAELNAKSNQLARQLVALGVGPEKLVGIMADRSVDLIVGVMAVWKAGGAYVPLDPDYPADRLRFMLEDSEAAVLLTQTHLQGLITAEVEVDADDSVEQTARAVLCLDDATLFTGDVSNLEDRCEPQHLAYVIYTSGTTGKPKGVMIEHHSLVNTALAYRREYRLTEFPVRLLQLASFSFDVFTGDIARTLVNGGTMVICPKEDRIDPEKLVGWIRSCDITLFESTPALIIPIMEHIYVQKLDISTMQLLITSSDSCGVTDYKLMQERFGSQLRLINSYGVTEAAIDSSFYDEPLAKLPHSGNVPIGKAWLNARFYIVDRYMNPVPVGVAGELCIGGPGVARGYLNRPDLSAEKFVPNPFVAGERLYRTGDLARWMTDGNVDFIGRIDHQVKIRGYRIELGEIETAMLRHDGVRQAIVIDRTDERGQKYLCGYAAGDSSLDMEQLQAELRASLPSHMVPSRMMRLERLPLTPNGKIDRKALPEPEGAVHSGTVYAAPRNPVEETLAAIWQSLLGVKQVGIHDSFFELGGDSIKSLQVSSRLYQAGYKLEMKDLFQYPTIAELSPHIRSSTRMAEQGSITGEVVLTPVQHWFFEQRFTDMHHHNQAVMLYRAERFEESALRTAMTAIVEHHDALRIVFREAEQGGYEAWSRSATEGELFSLELVELRGESNVAERINSKATMLQASIQLGEGPLVKLGLFRCDDGDHLMIAIHHLVVDGVSWRILFEDIATAYEQASKAEPIKLPLKTDSFQLWAEQQAAYANSNAMQREFAYWQQIESVPRQPLPKDIDVENTVVGDSEKVTVEWSAADTERLLKQAHRAYGTEMNDILLAALGSAVHAWTGSENVHVSLEGHGREAILPELDITRTVGWFTSQYPVVLPMKKNADTSLRIKSVKESLRSIPRKGIGYGIWRYLSNDAGKPSFVQEPEISFNYLGQFDQELEQSAIVGSSYSSGHEISSRTARTHALDINGLVAEGTLSLTISYSSKQYRKETMDRFAELLRRSLLDIIEHCVSKPGTELTPSDLSIKGMTIEELAQLEQDTRQVGELENVYRLTPMQQGMLFHSLMDASSGAYFEQTNFELKGRFEPLVFGQALDALFARQEIFRSNVYLGWSRSPLQIVYRDRKAEFRYEDVSGLSVEERQAFVAQYKHADQLRGFDLTRDALMRVAIIRVDDETFQFVWSSHHILMDGWCLSLVTEEVFELYFALSEGREPMLADVASYSRYIEWLDEQDQQEAANYWKQYLSDYETQTLLPTGKPQSKALGKVQSNGEADEQGEKKGECYETLYVDFGPELTSRMDRLAKQSNVTVNTLLQTVWGLLLQKYNGSEDVVFGSVVSGRPAEIPGIEGMIGLFINTIPVRIRCDAHASFVDVMRWNQEQALASNRYDTYPLFEIQALTDQKQELIQHILVFENFPVDEQMEQLGGEEAPFQVGSVEMVEQTNYDFNLIVTPGASMRIRLEYNAEVFASDAVERIHGHLIHAMEQLVSTPNMPVRDLEIVTPGEKAQIFVAFNETAAVSPMDKTIYQLLEEQAERTPEQPAVYFEGTTLTYRELNEQANGLARTLRAAGVENGQLVGLMVEKSAEMIVGMFGIMKAGGAYVPIDPEYPEDRIAYMLEDSGARLLLTQAKLSERTSFEGTILALDESSSYAADGSNLGSVNTANDLAYVIYTSGTTGKPKGVMVEHHGLTNLRVYYDKTLRITEQDKVLQFASLSFDAACWEIFKALFCGATLYIPTQTTILNYSLFETYMSEHGITIAALPPTYAVYLDPATMPSLRILFTAGSASSHELVQKWKQHVQYYNGYGPTENSIATTIWPVSTDPEADRIISIGRPMPNHRVYIVDPHGQLLPVGVPGELCVSGAGVARGYLNRQELTDEKFVMSRFAPGERMYRTGDLARWMPDGKLEYLGRIDHQVKIRGYRIELGEIEAQILKLDDVQEVIVLAREDETGQNQLCAYFVAQREIPISELRSSLAEELPNHMIPAFFMQLERMPLTPNDKIDRKALPAPDGTQGRGTAYVAPRTAIEEKLVVIWESILGTTTIGVKDNFFEIGGHSLRATALVTQLHRELNKTVSLQDVFRSPTIEQLAAIIESNDEYGYASIPAAEPSETYPVSSQQKRMYILNQLEGGELSYNMPGAMLVSGKLDREQLERAFRTLVERHETLRTSFELVNGEPVQRVHADSDIDFTIELHHTGGDEALASSLVRSFIRPFDLSHAPLLRVGLVELEPERHIMLFDMHHIISDGVSMAILIDEFAALYRGDSLSPMSIQYKDYAVWQQSELQSEQTAKQEAFWHETFSGEIPILSLTTDFARPAVRTYEADTVAFSLSQAESDALRKLAAETGSTLFMVLLAAYTSLLHRYTGQEDIVVGTPIAGRPHAELEPIIGVFVNTLALRQYPAAEIPFSSYLLEVKERALAAYEHQTYPFEELVEKVGVKRDMSRNPLFDTMFIMQNTEQQELVLGDLQLQPYPKPHAAAQVDLTLEIVEEDGLIYGSFQYVTSLFKRESMERLASHLQQLIGSVAANPASKLGELNLIDEEELEQVTVRFNDTAAPYPAHETIHGLFEQQAAKTPELPAVLFEGQQLTYRELNERANQLARTLQAEGVKPETKVVLMAERSFEMMIAIYAILKAGGAYVPIDPSLPQERIAYILEDSSAPLLLTQSHLRERLAGLESEQVFAGKVLDLNEAGIYAADASNLTVGQAGPTDVAYMIYTSGSTGKPKGVMVEHHSVLNRILWMHKQYPIDATDTIMQKTAITFDVSVWELFWWAFVGSKVCLLPVGGEKSPQTIIETIDRYAITTMHFVPAMLGAFLEYAEQQPSRELTDQLRSLRQVFTSGEALPPQHVARYQRTVAAANRSRLINLYGPTEATVDVSYFDCEPDGHYPVIPIGKPIENIHLYVVKEGTLQLQPIGVAGELVIAGVGVARGYLNRPELNAEKFIDSPFVAGERMYRTGDLVRWMPDGNIEYLGRIDHQVKIRGYRIELGEIETNILNVEGVLETVVMAREDGSGQKLLAAYFVAEQEMTAAELREALSAELPSYMVPTYFVQLERMPLSPNGKIDRKALPAPEETVRSEADYVAPRTETEKQLAAIWQEVLKLPQVGVKDNFFDIGGHSLRATTVVAKVHQQLSKTIALRDVFQHPTVEELARILDAADAVSRKAITAVEKRDFYPVTSTQKRMYILSHLEGGELSYNMPTIVRVNGMLDVDKLEEAFRQLIDRHESLRTSFEMVNGEVVQRVQDEVEFMLERHAAGTVEEADRLLHTLVRPFELSAAPLLRAGVVRLAEDSHLLIYDMHHIVSDGASAAVIMSELGALYAGEELPQLDVHYKDFAVWQQEQAEAGVYSRQRDYWLEQLAGELPVLELPIALPRPAVRSFEGALLEFTVESDVTEKLKQLAAATGSTMFMLGLAAYTILLAKYSGQDDLIVGTPVAGRQHAELEPMIGMFVNTLAIRNEPKNELTVERYVRDVKDRTLNAFENQDYPLEELIEQLQVQRDARRNPLFDVLFVMQNTESHESTVEALTFAPYEQEHKVAKFDMTLALSEHNGELRGSFEYSTKLYSKQTIERLRDDLYKVLQAMGERPEQRIADIEVASSLTGSSELLIGSVDFSF